MRRPRTSPARRPKGAYPAGRPIDVKSRSALLRALREAGGPPADSSDRPDGSTRMGGLELRPLDARFKRRAAG